MWKLGLIILAAFVLQAVLSMVQMRHFSNEFVKLRRQGKVACGRKAGGFHAGAIVLFLIDDNGVIQTARKLEGVTVLARMRPMDGFAGRYVGDLTGDEVPRGHRNLRKAVQDAALTYRKYTSGEELETPPTPFQQAGISAKALFQRKKTVG